jgi:hypothetical protein
MYAPAPGDAYREQVVHAGAACPVRAIRVGRIGARETATPTLLAAAGPAGPAIRPGFVWPGRCLTGGYPLATPGCSATGSTPGGCLTSVRPGWFWSASRSASPMGHGRMHRVLIATGTRARPWFNDAEAVSRTPVWLGWLAPRPLEYRFRSIPQLRKKYTQGIRNIP